MKFIQSIILTFIILVLMLVGSVNAQQNSAQQVYAIFEQSCVICHGENGAYRESLIIDHTTLIENGKVVPGKPDESVVYQRLIETDGAKRMPLGQPALDPAAIETIRQWIAAGAPDWDANPAPLPNFITTDVMLETIENHVNSLSPRDKSFARYFTLTHLYNAGETTETLNAYRRALSKLINSLSWGREIVKPQPIDAEHTVFYIDLRHYEWDVRNEAWTQIEQVYPYQMTFDAPTQTDLKEKLTLLQQETNSEVPFVHVDWFLATASLPPLYNNILALPETANELEESLDVSVTQNLQNAPGIRVWRAGFNDSGVSRHNRVVERHTSSHGAYWKSYDFAGSAESQNIFTHPLDFTHDGGEIIFNLPNGLQAYFLVDGVGNRLDVAPTDIVSNPAVSDPAVYNGLSCIGCHTKGMKTFEDEVRAVVEQADKPPYNKERALELYVQKTVMDDLVEKDTQRYRDALEAAGGVFGGIEPIQRFHEVFQGPLDAAHAAAAVGLETNTFLERVSNNVSLQNLLGALVVDGGTIKRDAWTSSFHDVVSELNSPDTVLPPVEDRPERIPGASVHIPDPNLRAALEDALGKAAGDVITVEDMESLTEFYAEGLGIKDITSLEYAINLRVLQIRGNMISDISSVSDLSNLSLLRIADNNISDISAIAGLTNISSLEIYANEITDISPLTGLTNVAWLSMYGNPVTDLSPLANLKRMDAMRVSVEEPGDLSPLAELTDLRVLYYWGSGNPVPDLTPLINLPKLITIDIRGVSTVALSPLAKVDTLERFEFWGSGENLPDMSPLAEAKNLKELWGINCGITDLTFLQNFTGLERLNLDTNNISDVSPLAKLTNLKWLKLTNNPITDFTPLTELAQTTNIIAGSVNIPDRNLRAAIAEALDKDGTGVISITFEEMGTLRELNAEKKEIGNLVGLEFAKNLDSLNISRNPISDLSPLAGLTALKTLEIHWTQLSDLSPLAKLINLQHLGAWGKDYTVSDLSPLSNLTNLKHLDMSGSREITDISPLANLTDLTYLRLYDNGITDISPLSNLINLEILFVEANRTADRTVWDLSPLANLTRLRVLSLANNVNHIIISDISPLSGLDALEWLDLNKNNISDISPLAKLTNLKELNLDRNKIVNVSPLAGLTNLTTLNINGNPITDFSPLSKLFENTNIVFDITMPDPNLRAAIVETLGKEETTVPITLQEMMTLTTLKASDRDIKDLTGLESAVNLEELWISKNPISDLSPLVELKNLIGLGAWETPISDLSPLSGLTKLRWLDFGGTQVSDLSPLAGITNLKKLTFYGCGVIENLSPLAGLTELTELNFGGNPISDLSPLAALINLEHLDFHGDDIVNLSPLAGLNKLRYLDLRANLVSDLSPLTELNNLQTLFLNNNRIADISPLEKLPVFPDIIWVENLGTPKGGPKIEGPWLWMKFPAEHLDTDWLAEASGGAVTEQQIATYGAVEGKPVGNTVWKTGKIDKGKNNINRMLDSLEYNGDRDNQVIYGTIILESLLNQQTNMLVGGGYKTKGNDMIKVWFNGELVHTQGIDTIGWPYDYGRFFPVTLKQGANVLLVAIYNKNNDWSGFFGFEEGTKYTLIPPGTGFSFSATETDNLLAGDTFTLNLNAENITDLAGWQADIVFDPNVLEAVEVTEGDFLKSEGGDTFFQAGTIENTAGKITDLYSARIAESGVSGTGTLLSVTFKAKAGSETQVTLENFEFISITGDIIPTVHPNITITVGEYPAWDVNQDGRVSIQDLVLVANDLGSGAPANLRTDVNRDGEINIQDLIIVAQHMGESTDSAAAPIVALDSNELTPAMVQAWIEQAQVEDDGSLVFQQGIENLKKLLATLLPEKTALLANYPNPFNPETWIPYHLAKPAEVSLTIYAANGAVVWTLALGHQAAGIYQNRDRAAHWDGRNDVGEPVASGIYFYTLTAGDFTSTRRMLIRK